jgi:uncharacterized membrane protein
MTDTTTQHNGGADALGSTYNVISASFDPDTNAFTALTALKELESQDRLRVDAAAVVVRDDEGRIVIKERVGNYDAAGAAGGGLLGLLVGVLGGPLGMLVGGSYGMLVGTVVDLGEAEESESVLTQISAAVEPGRPVLLAEVVEQSPEVIDTAMAKLGGTVIRRPVADIEAEIAAADEAERKARHEAAKELRRGRRERTKEQAHAKVQELKASLPHREKTTSAS